MLRLKNKSHQVQAKLLSYSTQTQIYFQVHVHILQIDQ